MRQQITDQLALRAGADAGDRSRAQRSKPQIKKPADLDIGAKAHGLTVQESGFFARDEPILGLGASPEVAARAFELNDGEVSGQIRTARGFVFETVTGKQDAYVPKLEEVKEQVRDEVVKQKALELASRRRPSWPRS